MMGFDIPPWYFVLALGWPASPEFILSAAEPRLLVKDFFAGLAELTLADRLVRVALYALGGGVGAGSAVLLWMALLQS
ncbi:MAG: hypothetical protein M3518_12170 [Actinomycetota bacterium]|nr:hypothetical protein [Actinomycetota bacterium]